MKKDVEKFRALFHHNSFVFPSYFFIIPSYFLLISLYFSFFLHIAFIISSHFHHISFYFFIISSYFIIFLSPSHCPHISSHFQRLWELGKNVELSPWPPCKIPTNQKPPWKILTNHSPSWEILILERSWWWVFIMLKLRINTNNNMKTLKPIKSIFEIDS